MYMPFLRGKQFELLAVRELAANLTATSINPIIEPVRERSDALVRCLDELALFQVPTTVIVNPRVGELASDDGTGTLLGVLENQQNSSNLRLGVCVRATTNLDRVLSAVTSSSLRALPVDLIHEEFSGDEGVHSFVATDSHHLVRGKEDARRYRPPLPGDHVKLADRFPVRKTNLEYVGAPPSLFTDDNVYFQADGYAGFSDYLTIGEAYAEGGSSPRAVVIHLTYPDPDGSIWIRHFCSTSNADTSDVAGKFEEAVAQLVRFTNERGLRNSAIDAFVRYANQGAYPGLGMVKKLSIQNHLWLMKDALADQ